MPDAEWKKLPTFWLFIKLSSKLGEPILDLGPTAEDLTRDCILLVTLHKVTCCGQHDLGASKPLRLADCYIIRRNARFPSFWLPWLHETSIPSNTRDLYSNESRLNIDF